MPDGFGNLAIGNLLTPDERNQSVVITDPSREDNPIIYVSAEFEQQTSFTPEDALGRNCRFLQGPKTDERHIDRIRSALRNQEEIQIDILNYRKDGTEFWNRLHIRPLFGANDSVVYFAGAQHPIDADDVRPETTG